MWPHYIKLRFWTELDSYTPVHVHESSVGSSSVTDPNPRGATISMPAHAGKSNPAKGRATYSLVHVL
jgi:hypothetical protein